MLAVVMTRAPLRESYPRVEKSITDVRYDLRRYRDENRDQRRRLDHIDIAEQSRVEQELAEAAFLGCAGSPVSASRTGSSGGLFCGRISCARRRGNRGSRKLPS